DNFTAFTDGARTWVNGPFGLQQRLNTERFDWEGAAVPVQASGDASRFAGKWVRRDSVLWVDNDGFATLLVRANVWCDWPEARGKVCDRVQDGTVIPGIEAKARFDRFDASTAYGKVLDTNAPGRVRLGPVELKSLSADAVGLRLP